MLGVVVGVSLTVLIKYFTDISVDVSVCNVLDAVQKENFQCDSKRNAV